MELLRLLILVVTASCALGQRMEGSSCRLENGKSGVCKKASQCSGAREQMRSRNPPRNCSFLNNNPIVCCNVKPSRRSPQIRANDIGKKSKEMCEKYASAVYTISYAPTLLVIREVINSSECVNVGQELIINGELAVAKEFPHMVALGYGETEPPAWLCGGSLISERFVLTAAHCMASNERGFVKWARLGDLNLAKTDDNVPHITKSIIERIPHEDYKPPAHYNDIALLKLDSDVTFNGYMRPACLHTQPGNPPNIARGTATGWGYTKWNANVGSDQLMKVDLPFRDYQRCNTTYSSLKRHGSRLTRGIDEDSMMCIGDPNGKKDTCGGDSGSPVQIRLKNPYCMFSIVAVTSFGSRACGVGDNPAVYTRVSYFVPWIERHVWP